MSSSRWGAFRALVSSLIAGACLSCATLAWAQPGRPMRIVVLGDSLSAGFLLPASSAFPAVLEATLRARGYPVTVGNAGVTGDTASGGLARVDRDVPEGTDGVILELGANDLFRGIDPQVTTGALDAIVRRLKARGIRVLIAGIRFSEQRYPDAARYNAIFPAVARRHGLVYHPDFYADIASDPRLTILDGLHPSSEGVRRMVGAILPAVTRFLGAGRAGSR